MKKKVLLLTIALLCIMIFAGSINFARADIILSDNFESGNLNAWTLFQNPSLVINNQITNNGEPYSVECTISPGQGRNIAYQPLPSVTNPINIRQYVYVSSIATPSTNGDYYQVGGFSSSQGPNFGDGELIVTNVGGTLYWGLFYRDASGSVNPTGFSRLISTTNTTGSAVPVTVGWTCLELEQTTAASGPNGVEKLYVNGQLVVSISNAVNWDRTPYNAVIGGSQDITSLTGGSLKYYIADVIVSSSYIGLNQNLLTLSSNAGTVTPSSGSSYAEGQQVTITAIPPTAVAGERYVFNGWTGSGLGSYSGTNNPATITMNSPITETAVWEHQYQLTILSPQGTVANNNTWYDVGTTATATLNAGTVAGSAGTQYVFSGWTGDAAGSGLTSNLITMNAPKTATATWTTQYYLTTSTAHGTVTGSGWYNAGTTATVTLNSATSPGTSGVQYAFTNWGTDATGVALTSNAITMSGPKTASTLWQTQYNLTVTQTGVGSDYTGNLVTVNGNAYGATGLSTWANANAVYTFSYNPQAVVSSTTTQYLITGVTGNTSATSVTVSAPTTVTAAYRTQFYLTVASTYDSPSPTSGWYDSGASVTAFVSSPSSGYTCTGWTGTGNVPATGTTSATSFTIASPSSITWQWSSGATATPTTAPTTNPTTHPTVTQKPSVTPTPTVTPKPSNATATPTVHPTASPTGNQNGANSNVNPLIYVGAVVIIVVIIASILLILRRKK
jgi:hypothetical protein